MPLTLSSLSREQLLSLLNEIAFENQAAREKIARYLESLNNPVTTTILSTQSQNTQSKSITASTKNTLSTPPSSAITRKSTPEGKIKLFQSLFAGRTDVYALRWKSKNGKSGYSPVCKNRFASEKCNLKIGCKKCAFREFLPISETAIFNHLRGTDSLCRDVIGVYAILSDSTCNFLALDFDEDDFKNDVRAIRKICDDFSIPYSVEISRSGNGSHVWFFFAEKIPAKTAREFGSLIIELAMTERHEISFTSFDRMFPNQDEIPSGGFGNLIALPLQGQAVKNGKAVFVDEDFSPYNDQWEYLSGVQKISLEEIGKIAKMMKEKLSAEKHFESQTTVNSKQNYSETDMPINPIQPKNFKLSNITETYEQFQFSEIQAPKVTQFFPTSLNVILSNKIYIQKSGVSEQALGTLKRLAVFHNPEFYQREKMRLPTYNIPRYIDCSEEKKDFLILPRGCFDEIKRLTKDSYCTINIDDNRQIGMDINLSSSAERLKSASEMSPLILTSVSTETDLLDCPLTRTESQSSNVETFCGCNFKGLSEQQKSALTSLLENDTGVLSASTGFGKTVLACALISERNTNTLILVHTNALLNQWKKAVKNFLDFDAGIFGGGKNNRTGIIDIALIQSLCANKEATPNFLKDYGCVISDECHHVSAFSFERVLKSVYAKYVYGLTATPFRRDGHEKIIFMQCGPIRFKTENRQIAESHGFNHFFIPRFVPFAPIDFIATPEKKIEIVDCYKFITENSERTKLICDDVKAAVQNGRTPIVISERIEHLTLIESELKTANAAENIILVTGKGSAKQKCETLEQLNSVPENESLILLATGKYIGEGFDNPRLDTLMLAMPVSWKGVLDQYVGRLHRKSANKTEVQIFDYIDFRIPPLEKMSHKRMKEYKKLGYTPKKVESENETQNSTPAIYSGSEFKMDFYESLKSAQKEIFISSPYLNKWECQKIISIVSSKITSGVKIVIVTKAIGENTSDDKIEKHKESILILQNVGCTVVEKENLSQRCAVIDSEIVWYGSANFLGFVAEDDCVMRIVDAGVAAEILGKG